MTFGFIEEIWLFFLLDTFVRDTLARCVKHPDDTQVYTCENTSSLPDIQDVKLNNCPKIKSQIVADKIFGYS